MAIGVDFNYKVIPISVTSTAFSGISTYIPTLSATTFVTNISTPTTISAGDSVSVTYTYTEGGDGHVAKIDPPVETKKYVPIPSFEEDW